MQNNQKNTPAITKSSFIISTYNVHTLLDNRIYELTAGCQDQHISLVAIQEHRWTTPNEVETYWTEDRKWAMLYTSAIEGQGGIGILCNKRVADTVVVYQKVSHRILTATFNGNPKLTFISAHAPHGGYPLATRQTFYDLLTSTIQAIPLHNITILGGDLNAQLGKDLGMVFGRHFYYDTTKNDSNGMLLAELCHTTGMIPVQALFQHPKSTMWTHKRPSGELAQLDHILINRKWANSARNCRAYNSVELASDHRILSANITLSLQSQSTKKLPCTRNWQALQYEATSQAFNTTFKRKYDGLLHERDVTQEPTEANVQIKYDAFTEALESTSQVTLPPVPRKRNAHPVTPQTEALRKDRNRAQRKYAKHNTSENKAELTNLNKQLRTSYQQCLINALENDLQALQHADQNGDSRTTWNIVRKISGKSKDDNALGTMTKPDGTPIPPDEETWEWMLYFQDLLNNSDIHVDNNDLPLPAAETLPINIEPFSVDEVATAIHQAKSGKAPGIDQVTAEALQKGGMEVKRAIHDICNLVYHLKFAPHQWKKSVLIPIFKKGAKKLMTNYRGISLMSVAAKLYNRLLLHRLRPVIDPLLRDNQAGFRADRSCTDQIHILRRVIEGAEIHNLPLVTTYVDFQKAFDSINRKMMFAILRHYGVPSDMVDAIKCIYDNSMSCVRNKGELSEFFTVITGVMQGDVLAPFLFIIVMDYILRRAAKDHGFTTHPRRSARYPHKVLNELTFADDIAQLAPSIPLAQKQLDDLRVHAREVGLQINAQKTEYATYNIQDNTPLTCDGRVLPINSNFKYLGAHMKDSATDITSRKGKALSAFWGMKTLWDNDSVPLQLKLHIFKSSVISIFLYACETWVIGVQEERQINSLATTCYRYILHINQERDHVTNEDLLRRVNEYELMAEVKKRQLKKLGHNLRKPPTSLANIYALYVPPHGRRNAGRQRSSFADYIATTLHPQLRPTEMEIRRNATDRKNWSATINRALQP